MQVIGFQINNMPNIKVDALCIGKFDGIHLGHETLIQKCKEVACGGLVGVLTFEPLPFVFFGEKEHLIYTEKEKVQVICNYNINFLLRLQFNESLAKMNGEAFLDKISKITKNIIVGEDFRFGNKQNCCIGDLNNMQMQFQYKSHIVEKIQQGNTKVSSTQLKRFIIEGDFEGYRVISKTPFFVLGNVVAGIKMAGKVLGFPTANMCVPQNKIMPPFGVYATLTHIDGITYKSISNYGIKPTVVNNKIPTLETHVFGINSNLYGKSMSVTFLHKIRDEQRFDDIKQLKYKISQDIKRATSFHQQYEGNKI